MLRRGNDKAVCDPCTRSSGGIRNPRLPADFHHRKQVAAAIRGRDFGRYLKAVRAELELTQEELGRLLGLAQSRVCKVENGQIHLRDLDTVARIVRIFAVPLDLLGFHAEPATVDQDHDELAVDWLDRRDFISAVTGIALGVPQAASVHDRLASLVPDIRLEPPRRLGLTDVARIEATTRAFRDWDNRWGGGLSRAAVIAQLHWVIATGRSATPASQEVHARLLTATSDLASVAAFINYDIGHHDEARRLWTLALDAAKEAQNPELVSATLRQLAHQSLHLDQAPEALRLVRLAYATTTDPDHTAAELALAELAAYEGWCYAALGDARACERAIGRSEDHFDKGQNETAPPWMSHLDHVELSGLHGHTYHVLTLALPAAAKRAQPLLERAVRQRGPEYPRTRTLNLIALASTHFQAADDLEQGVALGDEALAGAHTLNSPRTLARLQPLDTLTAPFAKQSVIADFRQRLHQAMAAA